jgi:hypothetical protein
LLLSKVFASGRCSGIECTVCRDAQIRFDAACNPWHLPRNASSECAAKPRDPDGLAKRYEPRERTAGARGCNDRSPDAMQRLPATGKKHRCIARPTPGQSIPRFKCNSRQPAAFSHFRPTQAAASVPHLGTRGRKCGAMVRRRPNVACIVHKGRLAALRALRTGLTAPLAKQHPRHWLHSASRIERSPCPAGGPPGAGRQATLGSVSERAAYAGRPHRARSASFRFPPAPRPCYTLG